MLKCSIAPAVWIAGARLTAFELLHDGLPSTLICDSAAASLMASGQVNIMGRMD